MRQYSNKYSPALDNSQRQFCYYATVLERFSLFLHNGEHTVNINGSSLTPNCSSLVARISLSPDPYNEPPHESHTPSPLQYTSMIPVRYTHSGIPSKKRLSFCW